jgi:membrane fusion protein, multidrug efflux system
MIDTPKFITENTVITHREQSEGHATNTAVAAPVLTPAVPQESGLIPTPLPEPPEAPKPPASKRQRRIGLILAGLGIGAIAATIFGYRYWQYISTHQITDNAIVTGQIHQISSRVAGTVTQVLVSDNQVVQPQQLLVQLDPKDYESKVQQAQAALASAQGQANAAQANISLASETANGNTSKAKGDISIAAAAIGTAQATVEEAQAGIAAAQAAVEEAEAGIPLAQAQVTQADANRKKAQTDNDRYNTLYQQGAVAKQQLDTAIAANGVAQAQKSAAIQGVAQAQARSSAAQVGVAKAVSQLAQAQEGIATADAKLAVSNGGLQQAAASGQQTTVNRRQYGAAQAAIAQAAAALKEAQLQLSYINISAPTGGRIGKKNVEVGNRIQVGAPLMAIIGGDYWVIANFKETQLDNIKPGQTVEIKLDAFPSHPFSGRVDSVSPASGAQFSLLPPDNATGNFTKIVQRIPVKVIFDRSSLAGYATRIAPGMSAEVTVSIK